MDYAPDVTDNAPIAHYTHDPKRFDNFFFPKRRLVHLRDAHGKAGSWLRWNHAQFLLRVSRVRAAKLKVRSCFPYL
jgi:hypothetical protein